MQTSHLTLFELVLKTKSPVLIISPLTISNEYIFSEVGVITTGEVTATGVGGHIIKSEALNIKC